MAIRNRLIRIFFISFMVTSLWLVSSVFASENKVIAYYFHGSFRCLTCHKLEEYSKDAIERNFKEEMAEGILEFRVVNIEEKENEHFVDEYQLYTKALVISKIKDNKETEHKNLEKIWEYVRNKEKFDDYVISEIKAFLKD